MVTDRACGQVLQAKRGYADTGAAYSSTQATGASWYYNWGTAPSNIGNYNATFFPMIWGAGQMGSVNYALSQASTYMLGFNEPERSDQANLSVSTAISDWSTISSDTIAYNSLHGTSIKLVSPAVSDTSAGESWLQSFMSQASSAGYKVDAVAFHWYDDDTTNGAQAAADFESKVQWYHNTFGLPVFITEFADHDWGGTYSQSSMIAANTQMLSTVIPWLNSQSYVAGYSWYNWFNDSSLFSGSPPLPTTLGYPYDGSVGSGTTADISGTNLGEHVAFLTGGTLAMNTSAGTIKYINALSGTSTITGAINWGLNSASSTNWVQIQSGATLLKAGTDTIKLQNGTITNSGTFQVSQGVLQFSSITGSGTGSIYLSSDGGSTGSTARIELLGGTTLSNPITFAQRADPGHSVGIRNVSGNNTLGGLITLTSGGNQSRIQSDSGFLTLSGGITTNATSSRNLYFQGTGTALVSGVIADNSSNSAGNINVFMQGTGTYTLMAANTYTGSTAISSGTLQLLGSGAPVASYSFSPASVSGTTVANLGMSGSALNGTFSANGGTGSISTTDGALAGTGAMNLNGDGSFLDISGPVTAFSNTSNWTISTWVKTTQPGFSIMNKDTAGAGWSSGNSTFFLGISGQRGTGYGGAPVAVRYGGGWLSGANSPAVNDGAWHMVTYTCNGTTETVYVDGVAEATAQGLGSNDIGNEIRLGIGGTGESDGQAASLGFIGATSIYANALSLTQIQSLYNSNLAGVGSTNILPANSPVSLTGGGSTLDLEAVNQTLSSLSGVAGSSLLLNYNSSLTLNSSGEFDGSVSGNGTINLPPSVSYILGGTSVAYTGSTTLANNSTLTLPSNASSGSIVTRTIGALTISPGGRLLLGSATSSSTRQLLVTSSVALTGGTVDLANNDMVMQGGGAAGVASLTNLVAQAYAGGTWQGSGGINSSSAANNTSHLTTLGVIQNDNGASTALYTTFDGTPVADADVLLKYTYYGDTNLDGQVDGSDYTRIDNAFLADQINPGSATGWFNGDFNYDGVLNGSDYTLIDNAYNTQGMRLSTQTAVITAQLGSVSSNSSVPEPASLGALLAAGLGCLGRRRGRHRVLAE